MLPFIGPLVCIWLNSKKKYFIAMPAHHIYIYINCLESICGASGKTRLSMLLDGPTKLDSTWRRLVRTASRAKSAVCHVQHHILRLHEL